MAPLFYNYKRNTHIKNYILAVLFLEPSVSSLKLWLPVFHRSFWNLQRRNCNCKKQKKIGIHCNCENVRNPNNLTSINTEFANSIASACSSNWRKKVRKFIFLQNFDGELLRNLGAQNFVLRKISMINSKIYFVD